MASNSLFTIRDQNFELHRYPEQQKNRSLQAWDSADELLINHVADNCSYDTSSKTLLVNDQFGALACYFANTECSVINDSWVSHLGIKQNLDKNDINHDSVQLLSPLDTDKLSTSLTYNIVLIKVPKQLDALKAILTSIVPFVDDNTLVLGAGKSKDIHTSTLKLFEQCFGDVTTSLAIKKSRLIFAKQPKKASAKSYTSQITTFDVEHLSSEIHNLPNVFSGKQLDIGARAIIPHLPSTEKALSFIDLGCGNGILGLTLLKQCPNAKVCFIDESFSAVETARLNVQRLFPNDIHRCTFKVNDCLEGFTSEIADWIVCNPPFHQQSAITDHIAWQMFVDAKRTLNKAGSLLVVGNGHLGYQQKLQRLFPKVIKAEQTKKFVILKGTKE